MRFSTFLWFLLGIAVSFSIGHCDEGIHQGGADVQLSYGQQNSSRFINDDTKFSKIQDNGRKRALFSFLPAWKAILKTTIDYRLYEGKHSGKLGV